MARRIGLTLAVLAGGVGAGCAMLPTGPSMMALPGSGRTFEAFRADDAACRHWAQEQIGGAAAQRAVADSTAATAITGAAVGAAVGAAAAGSRGAGVGAATGLAVGTVVGSGAAERSVWNAQQRYDQTYIQCMYASGHKVPLLEGAYPMPVGGGGRPPAAPLGVPSPPPGVPPPPPSRWRQSQS